MRISYRVENILIAIVAVLFSLLIAYNIYGAVTSDYDPATDRYVSAQTESN